MFFKFLIAVIEAVITALVKFEEKRGVDIVKMNEQITDLYGKREVARDDLNKATHIRNTIERAIDA